MASENMMQTTTIKLVNVDKNSIASRQLSN